MDDKQNKLNELLRELSDDDTRIDDGNMESYIFRLQDMVYPFSVAVRIYLNSLFNQSRMK